MLTAVDDGNGHENTSSTANGTHQVSGYGEETKNGSTKGGGGGDDALELLVHRAFTVTSHNLSNNHC